MSIAIAEGMKTKRQVIVMTPKSLRENYIEELKKCGDFMYKKKQHWEFISDPTVFETLSSVLNLPMDYIKRKRGAWLMDITKEPNSLTTTDMKSLDDQLNEMYQNITDVTELSKNLKTHLDYVPTSTTGVYND